jgi:hypothetical protein
MEEIEAKLREQASRGGQLASAEKLFNELIFEPLRNASKNTFEQSDLHDEVGQRSCRYYLEVLKDIRERCRVLVQTGEDARKELLRLKEPNPVTRMLKNVRR